MKQNVENEMQALGNAINSFGLKGYLIRTYKPERGKTRFILVDNTGISLTGTWDYTQVNHFIFGYGQAVRKFNINL